VPPAARRPAERGWWHGRSGAQQTGLVLLGIAAFFGLHYAFWTGLMPVVGAVVGEVPVLSTVVGWAFGGGAFVAAGVLGVTPDGADERTRARRRAVAVVWCCVGVLCVPIGWANDVALPTDFWAGLYAGAYGVAALPLTVLVALLLWWLVAVKLFKRTGDPGNAAMGWMSIAYATLLLFWGATLLRL
jgi:hypothetical protein